MAVHHINSNSIYHRDLKPENFLVKNDKNGKIHLHLNDFGVAKNTKPDYEMLSSSIGARKGTIEYLAPEILNAKLSKPNISRQDVWSIGVIAYQLCTLRLPFNSESSGGTMFAIINEPYDPIGDAGDYSDELKDLIARLLLKDPEERLSI